MTYPDERIEFDTCVRPRCLTLNSTRTTTFPSSRFPRTRGDRPYVTAYLDAAPTVPPHTRGGDRPADADITGVGTLVPPHTRG